MKNRYKLEAMKSTSVNKTEHVFMYNNVMEVITGLCELYSPSLHVETGTHTWLMKGSNTPKLWGSASHNFPPADNVSVLSVWHIFTHHLTRAENLKLENAGAVQAGEYTVGSVYHSHGPVNASWWFTTHTVLRQETVLTGKRYFD